MDKIIKPYIISSIICLLLVGCKNTGHVFLENNTNETIAVKVQLFAKGREQIIETTIQVDDSDGWSYEIDADENEQIDKRFISLIITNNKGCKVELNRNEINGLVSKSGTWKLSIDKNIMNCN